LLAAGPGGWGGWGAFTEVIRKQISCPLVQRAEGALHYALCTVRPESPASAAVCGVRAAGARDWAQRVQAKSRRRALRAPSGRPPPMAISANEAAAIKFIAIVAAQHNLASQTRAPPSSLGPETDIVWHVAEVRPLSRRARAAPRLELHANQPGDTGSG